MKNFINKICILIVIISIIARMALRIFASEHILAIQLLWDVAGVAAFLCLWTAYEMRQEEMKKNGSVTKDTSRLFLIDLILVVLYMLSTIFMFFK